MISDTAKAAEIVVEQRHFEYAAKFYAARAMGSSKGEIRDRLTAEYKQGYLDPLAFLFAQQEVALSQRPTDTARAGEVEPVAWRFDYRIAFRDDAEDWIIGRVAVTKPPTGRRDYRNIIPLYTHPATPSPVTDETALSEEVKALIASMNEIAMKMADKTCIYGDEDGPDHCGDCHGCLQLEASGLFAKAIAALASTAQPVAPIDMVLHCPACGLQHIDEEEGIIGTGGFLPEEPGDAWTNPPHRSHLCHGCGHIWRPADVATNGVAAVQTKGNADSPLATPQPAVAEAVAAERERCAKIVEGYRNAGNSHRHLIRYIAAAIRQGQNEESSHVG